MIDKLLNAERDWPEVGASILTIGFAIAAAALISFEFRPTTVAEWCAWAAALSLCFDAAARYTYELRHAWRGEVLLVARPWATEEVDDETEAMWP